MLRTLCGIAGFCFLSLPSSLMASLQPISLQTFAQALEVTPSTVEEVPWEKIIPTQTQVVLFGELHNEIAPKRFLSHDLMTLQRMGFDHLAIEMLDQRDQSVLEQFQKGQASIVVLEELLQRTWGFLPGPYAEMLNTARRLGMTLIALDRRPQQGGSEDAVMAERDLAMARRIAKGLQENPRSRWLVLLGARHSRRPRPHPLPPYLQSEILNQQGIESFSIRFEDTLLPSRLRKQMNLENRATQATFVSSHEVKDTDRELAVSFDGALFVDAYRSTPAKMRSFDHGEKRTRAVTGSASPNFK